MRKTYSLPSWWLPFFFEYLFGLWIKLKWLSHINEYCQFLFFYFLLRITTIIIFLQGQCQLSLIGCLFFLQNAETSGIISHVDYSKSTKPLLDNWVWNVQLYILCWLGPYVILEGQYHPFPMVCTHLTSIWIAKDISDFRVPLIIDSNNINELFSKKVWTQEILAALWYMLNSAILHYMWTRL